MTTFEHLGPYRVEGKLGQGGMGAVYRGRHVKTGEAVAVKLLIGGVAEQPRFRRRFAQEIETLKKLKHPNIVRLLGYGEEQGHLFYAMELVEGPSLLEHLRRVRRLGWDDAIGVGIEVCAALKHAHDLGVIHRDLKPANLLMSPEGPLKLTDFGIAKLFGASEQTAAGSVLGTADYMAPEQATGSGVTARTDLYALGSLLYACLAGRSPFGGRDLTQLLHCLRYEQPAPLELVMPEVPEELAELVHHLLSKEPADRPPTALAVGNRLRAMRAGLRRRGEQTQANLGGPTVGEPTVRVHRGGTAASADGLPTADRPTLEATLGEPAGKTGDSREGTLPSDASDAALADSPSSRHGASQSHFEAIDIGPRSSYPDAEHGVESQGVDWRGWLSVAGLLALLVATIAVAVWMAQPPTADDLYRRIELARENGNLVAADDSIRQFLAAHADDPRADEVRRLNEQLEADRTVRRLRLRGNRLGGVDQLPPAEQAFVEAMEELRSNPRLGRQRLGKWLDVFGHPGIDDPGVQQLAEVARAQWAAAREPESLVGDSLAEQLDDLIDWAEARLAVDERRPFYEGIEALYGDKPWASRQVERAAEALQALEQGQQP